MRDYHATLPIKKRNQIFRMFLDDRTALEASQKCKLARNTVNGWYKYFRTIILAEQSRMPRFSGEVELDQTSFFTKKRKRYDKVGEVYVQQPVRKVEVLGILQRGPDSKSHRVFVQTIKRADKRTLIPLIRAVVEPGAAIYTDMWRGFSGLDLDGYTHRRVNHRRGKFVMREGSMKAHTGTIDNFWGFSDDRLAKFAGIQRHAFHLHIAECAYRYNHKSDLEKSLRALIKAYESPKK